MRKIASRRIYRSSVFLMLFIAAFSHCRKHPHTDPASQLQSNIDETQPVVTNPVKIAAGSIVYVPAYARVYSYKDKQTMSLVTTLAVHNTDPDHPMILRSVRYFSEDGTLLKEYMTQPRLLRPMATAVYHLVPEKPGSGIGANAVVEWVSEHRISNPVIEAIMISTEGTHGISFISPGYVTRNIVK